MSKDQRGLYKLPLEIRLIIWNDCLPDPASSQEVYFYNRADFGPNQAPVSENQPGNRARLKVVIGYPVILHVCHESRDFALHSHGISFQWFPRQVNHRGQTHVGYKLMPCRPYRPETDVFLLTETDLSDLWQLSDRQRNDPNFVFRSIRHLALGSWHFMDEHTIEFWIDFMVTLPYLQQTFVIFGHYWGFNGSCKADDCCQFRHLTLVPFTEETALLHPEFSEDMLEDLELAPVKVTDFISRLNDAFATEAPEEAYNTSQGARSGRRLLNFRAVKMVAGPPESRLLG